MCSLPSFLHGKILEKQNRTSQAEPTSLLLPTRFLITIVANTNLFSFIILSFQECYVNGLVPFVTFSNGFFTQHNFLEIHPCCDINSLSPFITELYPAYGCVTLRLTAEGYLRGLASFILKVIHMHFRVID